MKIFIVEDDPFYAGILEYHLSLNPEYEVEVFHSGKECCANLHKKPDLITLDFSLPDMRGDEVLKKIKSVKSDIPVIIVSGQEDVSTAVALLKEGVYDYLIKGEDTKERLWNIISNARERISLQQELDTLRNEVAHKYDFSKTIIGNCDKIKKIYSLIEKAAVSNITISIKGETGTGKEVVAKAIHYNSARSKKPFVAVNVSAIPRDLIESELFGHEKGAFTGAAGRRIGKFEEANQGTLFLDEIGEMELSMQAKLLRVLQERELTRVGGNGSVKFDVRIIAATHRNLEEEVKKGNFREDLFYRLFGLPIELPPLRERGGDILILAKHFLQEAASEQKISKKQFSKEAQEKLMRYNYPGNIRELKALVELALVLSDGEVIEEEDIHISNSISPDQMLSEENTLKEYTRGIIKHFLEKYNHDVLLVAEKLDIGKSTIYRMIQNQEL
jgi:DNA-binding NtrC family response regulator